MNRERGSALGILLALVAIIAVVEGLLLIRMESRVVELEERQGLTVSGEQTPIALAGEVRSLEQLIEDQAATLVDLKQQSLENAREVRALARQAEALGREPAGAAPAAAGLSKGDLEKVVADAVNSRLEGMPQGQGGEWKPTLDEFQKALGLSENQVQRAEEVFDDAKNRTFRLLTIPRDDGTNVMDDLAAALRDEQDPEVAMKKVFTNLFTEKIPGRDEAYIVEVLRIKQSAQSGLESFLDTGQQAKLGRMNLDHLGVHTSYDPFAEYIQDSLR